MMLQNLPLRDRVVGCDMDYVNNLIDYASKITGTAEDRLVQYIKGCDEKQRLIQIKCKILTPKDLKSQLFACQFKRSF